MFGMLLLVALSALSLTRADSDCDACVAGRCHYRKPIISGFPVTSRMAIDQEQNVLYLQLNGHNVAIFLDGLQHRLVNMISTTAMTFNQMSYTLYLGTQEGTIYEYNLASNTTVHVQHIDTDIRSNVMRYFDDKLVYIETYPNSTSGFHFIETNIDRHFTYLLNYSISDFIIDHSHIFFVSNDTLYACDNQVFSETYPPQLPRPLVSKKNIKISTNYEDRRFYEWVYYYIVSPTERVIYKLSKLSQELVIHAGYKSGAVEDFVFGKIGVIVFRDADGSVAQWVPSPQGRRCVVEPPQDNYFVRETTCF